MDDYLFQIRFGHRYGFNFNEHYNDKVGVLRDFVRQRKKSDKTDIKSRKQQKQVEKEEEWANVIYAIDWLIVGWSIKLND